MGGCRGSPVPGSACSTACGLGSRKNATDRRGRTGARTRWGRGDVDPVGPPRERVPDVDHQPAGHGRHGRPAAATPPHLEPRLPVRREQRQRPVVGVGARAHPVPASGVAQEPQRRHRRVEVGREPVRREPQIERHGPVEVAPEREGRVPVGQQRLAEARQVGPEVGAAERLAGQHARVVGGEVEPDVVGLLAVRPARGVEPLDALGRPSPVVGGGADVEPGLLRRREGEEAVRRGEDRRGVEPVAREDDEPRIAERRAERARDPRGLGREARPVEHGDGVGVGGRHRGPSRLGRRAKGRPRPIAARLAAPIRRSVRQATTARCAARLSGVERSMR